jgi:hypothetical protein
MWQEAATSDMPAIQHIDRVPGIIKRSSQFHIRSGASAVAYGLWCDRWNTPCACLKACRKSIEDVNVCPVRGLRIIEISYLSFDVSLFRVVGNRGTKRVRASDPFHD